VVFLRVYRKYKIAYERAKLHNRILRLFAASWVVLFHINEPIEHVDNPYRNFVKLGALGVPVFFVISGYCIALAAQNSKGVVDFLIRRFFRIFPGYWFSLCVVILCVAFHVFFFGQNSVTPLPKSFNEILATLSLLTSPFSSVKTINWVYWSLTVEIFFYLAIGLTLIFRERTRLCLILGFSLAAFIPMIHQVNGLFFLQEWAPFGLGIGLFQLRINMKKILLPVLILLANFLNLVYKHQFDPYTVTSIVAFFIIAISVFKFDFPENPLSKLGDYAYSLYLIHVPIGVYLIDYMKSAAIQANILSNIIFDLGVLSFLLLLSSQVFKRLEKPGITLGRKVSKRVHLNPDAYTAIPS
jgi:peptidoglycan/LPS O-acetylase OafA/YrhL